MDTVHHHVHALCQNRYSVISNEWPRIEDKKAYIYGWYRNQIAWRMRNKSNERGSKKEEAKKRQEEKIKQYLKNHQDELSVHCTRIFYHHHFYHRLLLLLLPSNLHDIRTIAVIVKLPFTFCFPGASETPRCLSGRAQRDPKDSPRLSRVRWKTKEFLSHRKKMCQFIFILF